MGKKFLYGPTEIAHALGLEPGLVIQWRKRGKLPEPTQELAQGPVWVAAKIEPFIDALKMLEAAGVGASP